MRNADLTIDEDEAEDLLKEIQKQLKMRQWGEVIRLEVESGIDKRLLRFLKDELKVAEEDIFCIQGPIDLTFLMKMYGLPGAIICAINRIRRRKSKDRTGRKYL